MPVLKSRSGSPVSVSISFLARAVNDGVSDPMATRDVAPLRACGLWPNL
jgi:hypothetical protein